MRRRTMTFVTTLGILALVTVACGGKEEAGGSPTATGESPTPAVTTLKPGILTVGSCLDYSPFESVPPGGEPTGFDVELTDAIAAKLGLKVEWVKANFNTIFTAVNQNKFDMVAAAVTATGKLGRQRSQTVDFSNTYYKSGQAFTVNTTKTPDITSTDQVGSGDVIGVQSGTTGEDWAKTNLQPKGAQIKIYQGAPQAFTDLEAGNITGIINDAPSSSAEVAKRPDLKVVELIDTNEWYAFAFAKGNTQLVDAVNNALNELLADGTYKQIFDKYFPGIPIPTSFAPPA